MLLKNHWNCQKFLVNWVSSEGKFKGPSFCFEPSRSCVHCPWYEVLLSVCCTYLLIIIIYLFAIFFCLYLFFFLCSYYCQPVSPRRIFAHCKDEMDVIIVHCGFRLCTVKLWTVKMFRENSYGKKLNHLKSLSRGYRACPGSFQTFKCVNFTFSVHKLK